MKLPDKPCPPELALCARVILAYGPTGIGCSAWAESAPAAFIIRTEAGAEPRETARVRVSLWPEFCDALLALKESQHQYKTIVVDTADGAWSLCQRYYGDAALAEWERLTGKMVATLPFNLIFLSRE
jgi:hypothetical protein